MKKFIKIISPLLLAVVFLFGCSPADDGDIKNPPDGDQKPPVTEELKSAEEVYALLSDSQKKCDKYDLDKYMLPYWNSQVIYNESVIPYGSIVPRGRQRPQNRCLKHLYKRVEIRIRLVSLLGSFAVYEAFPDLYATILALFR